MRSPSSNARAAERSSALLVGAVSFVLVALIALVAGCDRWSGSGEIAVGSRSDVRDSSAFDGGVRARTRTRAGNDAVSSPDGDDAGAPDAATTSDAATPPSDAACPAGVPERESASAGAFVADPRFLRYVFTARDARGVSPCE